MKLTVDRVLQLVHERITAEPDSFGRKAALRRLAQLRRNIVDMLNLQVDIPRPVMSEESRELLKSPVTTKRPRAKRKKKVVGEATSITHPGPAPGEVEELLEGSSTTTTPIADIRAWPKAKAQSAQTEQEVK